MQWRREVQPTPQAHYMLGHLFKNYLLNFPVPGSLLDSGYWWNKTGTLLVLMDIMNYEEAELINIITKQVTTTHYSSLK